MRVNMDSSIATDPAFKLVARRLGADWKTVVGACYLVWLACYERRNERIRVVEADLAAELEGFAAAMIAEDLALDVGDGQVVFRGVKKRIDFLLAQAERGSKGGKRKGRSIRSARQANAQANAVANALGTAKADTPSPAPDLDLLPSTSELRSTTQVSPGKTQEETLSAAAPPTLFPSGVNGSSGPAKPKRKSNGITPDERAAADRVLEKLRQRSGRDYRADVHVEAVVARMRDGNTEYDCKLVVWDRANDWSGDEKMDQYLRPSTLFGRQKFPDYLAAARASHAEVQREKELEDHRERASLPPSPLIPSIGGKAS